MKPSFPATAAGTTVPSKSPLMGVYLDRSNVEYRHIDFITKNARILFPTDMTMKKTGKFDSYHSVLSNEEKSWYFVGLGDCYDLIVHDGSTDLRNIKTHVFCCLVFNSTFTEFVMYGLMNPHSGEMRCVTFQPKVFAGAHAGGKSNLFAFLKYGYKSIAEKYGFASTVRKISLRAFCGITQILAGLDKLEKYYKDGSDVDEVDDNSDMRKKHYPALSKFRLDMSTALREHFGEANFDPFDMRSHTLFDMLEQVYTKRQLAADLPSSSLLGKRQRCQEEKDVWSTLHNTIDSVMKDDEEEDTKWVRVVDALQSLSSVFMTMDPEAEEERNA